MEARRRKLEYFLESWGRIREFVGVERQGHVQRENGAAGLYLHTSTKGAILESGIEKGRIFTKQEEFSAWWKEGEVEDCDSVNLIGE